MIRYSFSIYAATAVILFLACAGPQNQRTERDFKLISTESIQAPDSTAARGITKILIVQDLLPEHLQRTSAVRDIRIVIDWKTVADEDSLRLRMVVFTDRRNRTSNQVVPVKLYDADCIMSPTGKIMSVKGTPKKKNGDQTEPDPKKLKRMEQVAASFARMFIPAFQNQVLKAGEIVASSKEHFKGMIGEDTVVQTDYIYRGLIRRDDRTMIVVDYDQKTEVGPYTIIQEGYHLYDAERRYLVLSKGATRILQEGKPYYQVKLHAETKFSK